MKATLEFNLPEDETELRTAIRAMDQLASIRDFYERLRSLNKHGHSFKNADHAVECLRADYCDLMQEFIGWE